MNILRKRATLGTQPHTARPVYLICKRMLDICIASALLVLLSPILAIIAILVVLDTPGPPFFHQERVRMKRETKDQRTTWQQRTFTFYKFRTMYTDSSSDIHRAFVEAFIHDDEESMTEIQGMDTTVRKIVNDQRVTPLGKHLRTSSLDELPQLWNVLRGEMSLVGPRPPIPYEVDMYEPWHLRRLEAKPGITGLWQVNARSSCKFEEMVQLDIDYVENQSFLLDLKILFQTPLTVLRTKGAV